MLEEIKKQIETVDNIWVLSHLNPDADAYGSSCALSLALRAMGKNVTIVNISGILPRYQFIPGVNSIIKTLPLADPELVIVCDCGTLARIGDEFLGRVKTLPKIISIDHHASNEEFAHYNFVRDTASSTAELIYDLLTFFDFDFSLEVATGIFSGIMGDTGSFRYPSTSARVFEIAANLVKVGVNPNQISQEMFANTSLATLKLQAEAIRTMQLHANGKIAEMIIDESGFAAAGALPSEAEHLVEIARDIKGVLVSVFIRKDEGVWRISMRSRDEKYNVAQIATEFGGGGHKQAAAFRSKKALEEFEPMLISKLQKLVSL